MAIKYIPVCVSNYTNVDMIKRHLFDIPYSTEVPNYAPSVGELTNNTNLQTSYVTDCICFW